MKINNAMGNILWSVRHLKSALRFVEIGRKVPDILKFNVEGLVQMGHYYSNIEKIVSGGVTSRLDNIGVKEGTDKASVRNSERLGLIVGHDYLRHYDFLLKQFASETFNLLEFGCMRGSSLRTWKEYFNHAQIIGVDLDETAKENQEDRIDIYIGNAAEKQTYIELMEKYSSFKIIIDDASHAWGDQRVSLELFWDVLESGGFYIIEDLECGAIGAFPEYPPHNVDAQPFFDYVLDRVRFLQWPIDRNPKANREQYRNYPPVVQKIEDELDMVILIPGAVLLRKK